MTDTDRSTMRAAIDGLYHAASLIPPDPCRILFVSSPLVGAVAASVASGVWWLRENPSEAIKLLGRSISEMELMACVGVAAHEATWRCIQSYRGEPVTAMRPRAATSGATDAATRAATDAATRDATYAATDAATSGATDAATSGATDAATYAATRDATDAATDAATYAATDAATYAATDAATYAATDTGSAAGRGGGTDAGTGAASGPRHTGV